MFWLQLPWMEAFKLLKLMQFIAEELFNAKDFRTENCWEYFPSNKTIYTWNWAFGYHFENKYKLQPVRICLYNIKFYDKWRFNEWKPNVTI